MVTLWHLILAWCFLCPISGALVSARNVKPGFGGYALAVLVGSALGAISIWTMETLRRMVAERAEGDRLSTQKWPVRALYFSAMLWIIFTSWAGYWTTSTLRRLVG
jgi:hypothetical protein